MFYFLLILLASLESRAEGEWWSIPRSEDQQYYYYVGISEGKEGLSHLQDKAFNKAMSELIREHFGMSIQINESAVEELRKDQFQVITKQSSAPLFIKGIGVVKTYEKELDEGNRIYVQIRADKNLLEEAIQNQLSKPGEDSLNTYGDSHDSKVDIKVKTHPQGALIHFGHLDRRFSLQGQGDARFFLPRGNYQMVVSSPGYATVTKEVLLQSEGREENIILEELNAQIKLDVYPSDAIVEIDGKKTTDQKHKVRVGTTHKFTISHPDYFTREIEYLLKNPENETLTIALVPKPSSLMIDVYPSHAKIMIDGKEIIPYQKRFDISPGKKKLEISAPGYFSHTEEIDVRTNREYPLKVIHLQYDDQSIPPSSKGFAFRFEMNHFVLYDKVGRGMYIPPAIHFEYQYISLGFGYNWQKYDKEEPSTMEKFSTELEDVYGTLRLITPSLGSFKFHLSGTYGQYHTKITDTLGEVMFRETRTYQGLGGGVRLNLTPKWSVHAEYFKINSRSLQRNLEMREDRVISGFAYEW